MTSNAVPNFLKLRLPTNDEIDAANRFTVHEHCVVGLAEFLTSAHGDEHLPSLPAAHRALPEPGERMLKLHQVHVIRHKVLVDGRSS